MTSQKNLRSSCSVCIRKEAALVDQFPKAVMDTKFEVVWLAGCSFFLFLLREKEKNTQLLSCSLLNSLAGQKLQ